VDGPEILARSLSVPHVADKYGRTWQYHPRSDHHSKIACWAIMFDLLQHSDLLRRHVVAGKVVFGVNHEMRDFKSGRKKNLDLVIAVPRTQTALKKGPRSFSSLIGEWGIVLDKNEQARLSALPTPIEGPVGAVLMALEAKACMTEHIKAIPRYYDELHSSQATVHGASDEAIAAGFTMVNLSNSFISPDRNRFDLSKQPVIVTHHDQPRVTVRVIEKLLDLPRRTKTGEVGFDALGIVVVKCKNDGSAVTIVNSPPAPKPGDIHHYEAMIRRVAQLYNTRFGHI
jgi:hypothetical protein